MADEGGDNMMRRALQLTTSLEVPALNGADGNDTQRQLFSEVEAQTLQPSQNKTISQSVYRRSHPEFRFQSKQTRIQRILSVARNKRHKTE